jgi:two-component system, chemotaxis family, CheB/CheR fusion protein
MEAPLPLQCCIAAINYAGGENAFIGHSDEGEGRQLSVTAVRGAKRALEEKDRELRDLRELFRVTLSSIGDAVITSDVTGKVTFLNPTAESMTGWTAKQAIGQSLATVFNTVNELTGEPNPYLLDKGVLEGRTVSLAVQTSLVARHGGATWIEHSAVPIRDPAGGITGVVTVFHDVTARRQAQIRLTESELRFRTIFNQAAVGIAVTDLTGRFLEANQKFADIFGYSLKELQNRTFLDMTHPLDLEQAKSVLHKLVSQEIPDTVLEKRCVCKDGAVIWSLNTITLVRDPGGQPLHLIGIVEDITARKMAEEAQARLVAVITSSDDSIISMTPEGVIASWNRGAELMYGYTASEMIGKTTAPLIPPDRLAEEPAILERIRRGERIEHFETVRLRKDGTSLDVSIAVSPIEDSRGRVIGASKITRDITQSKQTEAVLRETDRRKDEFLATLAHELRNPLAPIRQAALISKAPGATEAQKRWSHDVISRQVHNMSLLLDDLLDISRITRGTLELRLEATDINDVIEAAVETARPNIDAKRHVFSVSKSDEPVQLVADPLRLAQVLSNLLTNAAKYTDPEGQIQLRVESTAQDVTLVVTDSGIGLAASAVEHVFDMFSQIKSPHDRSEGGLGIGLALAKGLVDLHGGRIEARSAGLDRGSEFIVCLPRRQLRVEQRPTPILAEAGATLSRRILIADDNRDAAESLSLLLQIEGHQVRVVHDGLHAVAALAEFQPEVALLDIGMPGLDGYGVARMARRGSLGRAVTLIALTGWGQDRDKAQALAAGFNHHFTKPVEPEKIVNILRLLSSPKDPAP